MMLRRDVHGNHFNNRVISDSDTEKILHAGLLAPSVGFSQSWEFIVIRDKVTKQAIADNFERENTKVAHLFKDQNAINTSNSSLKEFYLPSIEPTLGRTNPQHSSGKVDTFLDKRELETLN